MTFTDRDLAILVPMLGRPHHVAPLAASIRETVPDAHVVWLMTPDHAEDAEVRAAIRLNSWGIRMTQIIDVPWQDRGDYARKINTGYRATREWDCPLIFTGASDIRFRPGWFDLAVKHFEDPRIGVVGTNDVHSRRAKLPGNRHATHFLVRRSYVDEHGCTLDGRGVLWTEAYWHEYGDDELVGVTDRAGAYVYEPASIVEHIHPYWLPDIPSDPTYDAMGVRVGADAPLFRERHRRWT